MRLLERTVVCAALIKTLRGERELRARLLHKQGAAGHLTHGEQQSYSILVFVWLLKVVVGRGLVE